MQAFLDHLQQVDNTKINAATNPTKSTREEKK